MKRTRAKILRGLRWLHSRRRTINAWVVRAVSFYFGYKILNHEIYHAEHTDPILVFLGLWLCGVAPATFFDSMRKAQDVLRSATDTADAPSEAPEPKPNKETGDHA